MTAVPEKGHAFVEWAGFLEGVTDNPTEIVITENMTVSAVFTEKAKVSPWVWGVVGAGVAAGAVTLTYLNKRRRRKQPSKS